MGTNFPDYLPSSEVAMGNPLASYESSSNCTSNFTDLFNHIYDNLNLEPDINQHIEFVWMVYAVICAIGLLANIGLLVALIFGITEGTTFKVSSTIFITNLAIADTLILLTLPFAILQRKKHMWIYGPFACKLVEVVKYIGYYSAMFFVTAMAVDRYFAVCRAVAYQRKRKFKYLWFVSLGLWFLGLLFSIPIMIYADVNVFSHCNINFPIDHTEFLEFQTSTMPDKSVSIYENVIQTKNTKDCNEGFKLQVPVYSDYYELSDISDFVFPLSPEQEAEYKLYSCRHDDSQGLHIWLISNFIFGFFFPFVISSLCYIMIMRFKSKVTRRRPVRVDINLENMPQSRKNGATNHTSTSEQQFTNGSILYVNSRATGLLDILIPILISAFLICWLPFHIWHLLKISGLPYISEKTCSVVRDVTICLAFSKSALNPILNSFFLFNFKGLLSTPLIKRITRPRVSIYQAETEVCNTIGQDVENRTSAPRMSNGNVLYFKDEQKTAKKPDKTMHPIPEVVA